MAQTLEFHGYQSVSGSNVGGASVLARIWKDFPSDKSTNYEFQIAEGKQWMLCDPFPYEVVQPGATGDDLREQDRMNGFDNLVSGREWEAKGIISLAKEYNIRIYEQVKDDGRIQILQYGLTQQVLSTLFKK